MESSSGAGPADLKYSAEGLWVRIRDGLAIVGLTDRAQAQLGCAVDIELPRPGAHVGRSEHLGTVEASKVAFDLVSPLSGQVLAVNQRLAESPELINSSPFSDAWLVKITLDDPGELDSLLSAQQYAKSSGVPSLRRRFEAPPDRGY